MTLCQLPLTYSGAATIARCAPTGIHSLHFAPHQPTAAGRPTLTASWPKAIRAGWKLNAHPLPLAGPSPRSCVHSNPTNVFSKRRQKARPKPTHLLLSDPNACFFAPGNRLYRPSRVASGPLSPLPYARPGASMNPGSTVLLTDNRDDMLTTRQMTERLMNLHDVFLNASLQRRCMESSPLVKEAREFHYSDRARFERVWIMFLYVLVEAWRSRQMTPVRTHLSQVLDCTELESVISQSRVAE